MATETPNAFKGTIRHISKATRRTLYFGKRLRKRPKGNGGGNLADTIGQSTVLGADNGTTVVVRKEGEKRVAQDLRN